MMETYRTLHNPNPVYGPDTKNEIQYTCEYDTPHTAARGMHLLCPTVRNMAGSVTTVSRTHKAPIAREKLALGTARIRHHRFHT